jgi:uncharacterized protein
VAKTGSRGNNASMPAAVGIGLRPVHHRFVLDRRPEVAWFEVHAENFMSSGPLASELDAIAACYPLSLHCVGLSLGSVSRPERAHLRSLCELATRYCPELVSDHLSWNEVDGIHLPDLLPLPYTEEALRLVIRNVLEVQDALGRQILLENPSKYLGLPHSTLSEAEFLAEVVLRTDCGVLLDVNNLFVSCKNQGTSPRRVLTDFLATVSHEAIAEVHLAGHSATSDSADSWLIDDHGSRVCAEVWALYAETTLRLGTVPALIEWDTQIPAFNVLQQEAAVAQSVLRGARHREFDDIAAA